MKRSIIATIGFLLIVAMPGYAHADGTGLSPQVTRVLEKAQRGIDAALSKDSGATMFDAAIPEWLDNQLIPLTLNVDTRYALVRQSLSLGRDTGCFRTDQWIVENKMLEVQQMIDAAAQEKRIVKMSLLQMVYDYLRKEHQALLEGGINPEVTDPNYTEPYLWDVWDDSGSGSSSSAQGDEKEVFALFSTDYLPPQEIHSTDGLRVTRLGCDAQTLERALSLVTGESGEGLATSLRTELEAERAAEHLLEQLQSAEGLDRLGRTIDALIGAPEQDASSSSAASLTTEHRAYEGAGITLPDGVVMHALRGPFSTDPDDVRLLQEFWKMMRNRASEAPTPRAFTWVKDAHSLLQMQFSDDINDNRAFAVDRAGLYAGTFAVAADPLLSAQDTFRDLRDAVEALVQLGNSREHGLRAFLINFGSFLRRTCIDRPGNTLLRNILNAAFTDDCFIYGNGTYASDPSAWQRCKSAAGE